MSIVQGLQSVQSVESEYCSNSGFYESNFVLICHMATKTEYYDRIVMQKLGNMGKVFLPVKIPYLIHS